MSDIRFEITRDTERAHTTATSATSGNSTTADTLGTVARAGTAIWLVVSTVNFVVWLLVSIIGGDVDQPWFLWAFAGGGAVVGALHIASRTTRGVTKETA